MNLRTLLTEMEKQGLLVRIGVPVDPYVEMAQVINALHNRPVLFEHVAGFDYPVVAGLCARREFFALGLGVSPEQLPRIMQNALCNTIEPEIIPSGPCQEIIEHEVDLTRLPILTHFADDPGPYVTAGVAIVKHPTLGRNMSYHRLLRLDERRFAARIVEGRGTDSALRAAGGEIEIAFCIGNSTAVLLAAAMSPAPGVDELGIANALEPTPLVKCQKVDLEVPADAEFVLEGRLTREMADEGPFFDLTLTRDIVRQQPIFEVTCITHRRAPIYQALLPGGEEHKLLMGMPREPTIFQEVSKVCDVVDVLLTPGGGSWLHAVVQIRSHGPEDGRRAIEAAFRGHPSLKHVIVVDEDVNIHDPADVEWALSVRFQADRDLLVLDNQPGSSLDPSATHVAGEKSRTSKMGLDATIPWTDAAGRRLSDKERARFKKVRYPPVDLAKYL
ncbi:MAG: UbiD family decarboxylase [Chloroflexi bacterium]|nr:UbiD family decarboxylase [Chloroflexota bacterium]